jgi:hypothetical protein
MSIALRDRVRLRNPNPVHHSIRRRSSLRRDSSYPRSSETERGWVRSERDQGFLRSHNPSSFQTKRRVGPDNPLIPGPRCRVGLGYFGRLEKQQDDALRSTSYIPIKQGDKGLLVLESELPYICFVVDLFCEVHKETTSN